MKIQEYSTEKLSTSDTASMTTKATQLWKVFLSITVLVLVIWMSDVQAWGSSLEKFSFSTITGVLGLCTLNLICVSFRLKRTLRHFGFGVTQSIALKASIFGYFASFFVTSLLGQITGRHWILQHFGVSSIALAGLTFYERITFLVINGSLCVLGFLSLLESQLITDFIARSSLLEIVVVTCISLFITLTFFRSTFETNTLRELLQIKRLVNFLEINAITFLSQCLLLSAFVVTIKTLSPNTDVIPLFAASAIISFAASLPISIHGWGIREATAVYVLGKLGIPSIDALTISIFIGIASTLVLFIATPFVLKAQQVQIQDELTSTTHINFPVEKVIVWVLATCASVCIFFQIHLPIFNDVININLADPLALLSLGAFSLYCYTQRKKPQWRMPNTNVALALLGFLLIVGFFNGVTEIGITQWALVNRLMGLLFLLGYMSFGALIINYTGQQGIRRFIQTLLITAFTITVVQIILRMIYQHGGLENFYLSSRFQGYSGNRNTFAFQMILCCILFIAYHSLYKRPYIEKANTHYFFACLIFATLIASTLLTGSRTGLIVITTVLLCATLKKWLTLKTLGLTLLLTYVVIYIQSINFGNLDILSMLDFSSSSGSSGLFIPEFMEDRSSSDTERWQSMQQGLELFLQYPLFGAGLGVFFEHSTQWSQYPIVIHSTPIWIGAEFGLIGFAIFLWMFMQFVLFLSKRSLKKPQDKALVLIIFAFTLFSSVHEIFYQRFFWLLLGCFLATRNFDKSHVTEKKEHAKTPFSHRMKRHKTD